MSDLHTVLILCINKFSIQVQQLIIDIVLDVLHGHRDLASQCFLQFSFTRG